VQHTSKQVLFISTVDTRNTQRLTLNAEIAIFWVWRSAFCVQHPIAICTY